jgi:hypothetical protein
MPRTSSPRARASKKTAPSIEAMPMESPKASSGHEPVFSRPPVILAILGTMIVAAIYLWVVQPAPTSYEEGPNGQTQEDMALDTVSGLISRVSALIVVKGDETPTVYSVTDVAAFTEAWPAASAVKEGDKVLEWSDKTVIYSPTEDKIVAVLPALEGGSHEEGPTVIVAESGVTIEIRNASGVGGAAGRLQRSLEEKGFEVARIGDARTRISEGGTILIDFTNGGAPNALTLLKEAASGTVTTLPEGEVASQEDILILIGNE